ncbi:MATE family efflux transporter [Ethanoligenens sp.]|uniref:MATE family efflux transporter n=1 Tax=Ethanoligenens sp. TaxID=2099655 RepID=UPI0039EB0E2D
MNEASEALRDRGQNQILCDNLWKVMVRLSWPAIVAMVLYGLNAVLAGIFVGRYVGEDAMAGVSVAYPLSQISVALGSLIGTGAGAVLSIAIGRKDTRTQQRLMGNVHYLTILCTILYMVIALLFSHQLVEMMGGTGPSLALGEQYYRVTVYGAFFWIYGLAANMIVRAEGKMKSAALMMAIGLLADVGSNFLLVVHLHWGVVGAGIANNIGMAVYTVIGLLYFGRGFASFKTRMLAVFRDKDIVKSTLGLGISAFIMTIMNLLQAVLVFNALKQYGTLLDTAFYGVVYRIFTFLLTPIFGLMRALQPVAGINYGAKQYQRVIKSYWVFTAAAIVLTLPFWLLSMISPDPVLNLMLPNQHFAAAQLLQFRIYMAILPVLSIIFTAMTFFPSINKGKPAAILGIARQLVFYVPVMLFLPRFIGVSGIYFGSFAIDSVMIVWTFVLILKEVRNLHSMEQNRQKVTVLTV